MTKFIMLVGLSGSGKSTWAKQYCETNPDAVIISSDALRAELLGDEESQADNGRIFNEMDRRTKAALKNGKTVIYDAININRKRRINCLKGLNGIDCYKVAVVIATPFDECLERNAARDRKVPEYAIERMYKSFEPPHYDEGFNEIETVQLTNDPEGLQARLDWIVLNNKLCVHDNPHHSLSCGDHCRAAHSYVLANYFDAIYPANDEMIIVLEAAMFHDMSKYKCKVFHNMRGEPTEIAHFYNHENVSAYDYLSCLPDLNKRKMEEVVEVANLIANHMVFYAGEDAIKARKKIYNEAFWKKLELLHEADMAAH